MSSVEESNPIAVAIASLTAAARRSNTVAGTVVPVDFAEIVCDVLTSVAANLGGVDALLAGRTGSWEADSVRRIVTSTASEETLQQWRTEPLRIRLDAAAVFESFGLYALAEQEIGLAEERALDEHLRMDERAAAAALAGAIPRLREQDLAAYTVAYAESIQMMCLERDIDVDVVVIRVPDFESRGEGPADPVAEDFHGAARRRTPLPMTGQAPDWSAGTPADAVERAGLGYGARLAA